MSKTEREFQEAEANLRAAGVSFEVVAGCDTPQCLWCVTLPLPAAA